MTAESPEPWSAHWVAAHLAVWTKVMNSTGFESKGVHSESWVDRAVAVGPALIADSFYALLTWTPEWQKLMRQQEQANLQAASTGAGEAVQLGLPI